MMKKDMNSFNKNNITENSINIVNNIIANMEGKSFHNHYHILYDICNFLNKKDIVYLEIGTFAGGSASLVASNENVVNVFSIDLGQPINKEIPLRNVNKFKQDNCKYEYFQGNSTNELIINQVKKEIKNIDILFIDGSHSYEDVIKDFINYSGLVTPNGYIVFDDYLDSEYSPDVYTAVNDIVKKINISDYEIIGSLEYDLLTKTNQPKLKSSNEYILKKIR